MISIHEFIDLLEEEFEDIEPGTLKPASNYRSIENWGSLHALIIIALADTEFDVSLSGTDLKNMETIQDLYDLIQSKKN